jgi:D-alanine-D-alanine ligase-like ATP-grasp enzyme
MGIIKDEHASYKLLARALEQKGYAIDVTEGRSVTATYTRPTGEVWKTRAAHLAYPFTSSKARSVSQYKNKAYELAEEVGFSYPSTVFVTDLPSDETLESLLSRYKKLIVKPNNSSLSRGLTVNIETIDDLKKAIAHARKVTPNVLIQEQVKGEEIRFTVIEGKVEAALLRRTARVIGDGVSSISALIQAENELRKNLTFDYITYPLLSASLVGEERMQDARVPAKGEIVELSHSTMIRGGCSVYDILPEIHPSYIKQVENLVAKLDAGFVVVDVFCQAFDQPATPENHWFIEFNTAPVLKLYYSCRDGKHFDIVSRLADAIDRSLATS